MKSFLFLVRLIFASCLLNAQTGRFEVSDSLFKNYKTPVIERKVFNRLQKDDAIIYVGGFFSTDTAGNIVTRKFIPFLEVGNNYLLSDSVWNSVTSSLMKASKEWIFKPILWSFEKHSSEEKLNKKAFQRPYNGRPNYFIIFEVSGIEMSLVHKVSFIKSFKLSN